jgi:hypothetical protein
MLVVLMQSLPLNATIQSMGGMAKDVEGIEGTTK